MKTKIDHTNWKSVALAVTASLLMSGVASAGTIIAVSLPSDTFDTSVPIATVIIKPLNTTNIDASVNYIGFQGDFTFDSAVVTFQSPFVQDAGLTAANWNVAANILNTGPGTIKTLRVSAFSSDGITPLNGSGTLFNLRMLRVSSAPGASTALIWAADPNNFLFIDADLNTHAPAQNNGLITITGPGATPMPIGSPQPVDTPPPEGTPDPRGSRPRR